MALSDINSDIPRLKLNKPIETKQLVEYIKQKSGVNRGEVLSVLYELQDALTFFLSNAEPVRLEGIGLFSPSIKMDGTIKIKYIADKELAGQVNNHKEKLMGRVTNKQNLGKTTTEIIASRSLD